MRREWIDEEKPRPFGDSIERDKEVEDPEPNHPADPQGIADQALFVPDPNESTRPTISLPGPEDDDLDELLKEQNEPTADGEAGLQASFLQASDSNGDDYDAEYEAMKELGM